MDSLLIVGTKSSDPLAPRLHLTAAQAHWQYIGFTVYPLFPGRTITRVPTDSEVAVIVLEGTCAVKAGTEWFTEVGARSSVFDSISPEAVYCPPQYAIEIRGLSQGECVVATAPAAHGVGGPRLIRGGDIPYEVRGEGYTQRYIRHILDEHHMAEKLLLAEVVTPPGNWSSFPPHKHDEEIPNQEAYLEEIYYYRMNPGQGHALQRVYTHDGFDVTVAPGDGDVVLVPRGYHMVASPPGFATYYLNVMAGHHRAWRYTLDPDYAHIAPKDGNIMGQVFGGGFPIGNDT